ncbi:hypothetical protein Hdeb2414_s0038g00733831 [Helianthus debilis subsp. tardiflorus]
MQSKMDAKAGNDANGLTDPRLDKRYGSLGKKRVKWNLCAREAYSDAR